MAIKKNTLPQSMTQQEFIDAIMIPPKKVINKGNSKLKKTGFSVFSIPALKAVISEDGETLKNVTTCKSAGECADFCYAQQGGFIFKSSMVAHTRNLQYAMTNPWEFMAQAIREINSMRGNPTIRVHDSGDFVNGAYLDMWLQIMEACPQANFYAYTKEVHMMKSRDLPNNFTVVYSYGGKQDHLINPETDRHSRVFKTEADLVAAGYVDGSDTDAAAANPDIKDIGLVFHSTKVFKKTIENVPEYDLATA